MNLWLIDVDVNGIEVKDVQRWYDIDLVRSRRWETVSLGRSDLVDSHGGICVRTYGIQVIWYSEPQNCVGGEELHRSKAYLRYLGKNYLSEACGQSSARVIPKRIYRQ